MKELKARHQPKNQVFKSDQLMARGHALIFPISVTAAYVHRLLCSPFFVLYSQPSINVSIAESYSIIIIYIYFLSQTFNFIHYGINNQKILTFFGKVELWMRFLCIFTSDQIKN
jgi:hypothetical protein